MFRHVSAWTTLPGCAAGGDGAGARVQQPAKQRAVDGHGPGGRAAARGALNGIDNLNVTSAKINQGKRGPFTAGLLRLQSDRLRSVCIEQLARQGRGRWMVDDGTWARQRSSAPRRHRFPLTSRYRRRRPPSPPYHPREIQQRLERLRPRGRVIARACEASWPPAGIIVCTDTKLAQSPQAQSGNPRT